MGAQSPLEDGLAQCPQCGKIHTANPAGVCRECQVENAR